MTHTVRSRLPNYLLSMPPVVPLGLPVFRGSGSPPAQLRGRRASHPGKSAKSGGGRMNWASPGRDLSSTQWPCEPPRGRLGGRLPEAAAAAAGRPVEGPAHPPTARARPGERSRDQHGSVEQAGRRQRVGELGEAPHDRVRIRSRHDRPPPALQATRDVRGSPAAASIHSDGYSDDPNLVDMS